MVLLGCRPKGRLTEQHDIFFGIAHSMSELLPAIIASWPEAKGLLHIDAFREVTQVGDYRIHVSETPQATVENSNKLFFINLGGYKPGEFDEFHYKLLVVAPNKGDAISQAKQTTFYKHVGFKGATSHIDDKYGVDVDDAYEIKDILPTAFKEKYHLAITSQQGIEDVMKLGYFPLRKIEDMQ